MKFVFFLLLVFLFSINSQLEAGGGNPLGKGDRQDTNPLGKGDIQDSNPLGKGYYQKTSGKYRCKYHAGASTGPRSIDGKIKALRNLKHFKNKTEQELIEWIKQKRYAKD
mgnify:CR=1 FL=1